MYTFKKYKLMPHGFRVWGPRKRRFIAQRAKWTLNSHDTLLVCCLLPDFTIRPPFSHFFLCRIFLFYTISKNIKRMFSLVQHKRGIWGLQKNGKICDSFGMFILKINSAHFSAGFNAKPGKWPESAHKLPFERKLTVI